MSTYKNRSSCKSAQLHYYDLLNAATAASVPKDVHEHVDCCDKCQSDIKLLKALLASIGEKQESEQSRRDKAVIELLSLHLAWTGKQVGCTEAKPFLPSLADPLLRITRQTPITKHVENCRACSEDLSALIESGLSHKQLCRMSRIIAGDPEADAEDPEIREITPLAERIMERPDSRTVTIFTLDKSNSRIAESGPTIIKLKRFLKPAIAAAAIILIGFALFFNGPAVKAVGPEKAMMKALQKVENIHITHFSADGKEPEQERWLSQPLNKSMSKKGEKLTLWDFSKKSKTVKESPDAKPKAVTFTAEEIAAAKARLNNLIDIEFFKNNFKGHEGGKWESVPNESDATVNQGDDVYTYSCTDGIGTNTAVKRRCRFFVDPATNRPRRIEFLSKMPDENEYTPLSEYNLDYPSEEEIRAEIEKDFSSSVSLR